MEGSEGSIVSSFTPISQLHKARAWRHFTCPSIICIIVQLIQPLQVLCIDDGGPGHSLQLLPNWARWARQAEPVLFSVGKHRTGHKQQKENQRMQSWVCNTKSVLFYYALIYTYMSLYKFLSLSSSFLPLSTWYWLPRTYRSKLQPLQSRITPQFPCLPALQTHNAHTLAVIAGEKHCCFG